MFEILEISGAVFTGSFLIVLGGLAYLLIKNLSRSAPPLDFRHVAHEVRIEELHISRNQLVMHGSQHEMVEFSGSCKPEVELAFQQYMQIGLRDRIAQTPSRTGRFFMCTHFKPAEEAKANTHLKHFKILFVAAVTILAVLMMLRVIPADEPEMGDPVDLLLTLASIALYIKAYSILIFPKWQCTGQRLSFKGLLNEKNIFLQNITSLEFTLVAYAFKFSIQLQDGTSLNVKNKKLVKLLPLYDCIVHHRPELRFQPEHNKKDSSD